MAFLIYNRTPAQAGHRYQRVSPIQLAGPGGIIARYVASLTLEATADGWKLPGSDIPELAGVSKGSGDQAVLVDLGSSQPQAVCLYELASVFGTCRDKATTLVMEFMVLIDEAIAGSVEQFRNDFEVAASKPRHVLHETMELSGGPRGGDWRWCEPKMNIGATVVAPTPGGLGPVATSTRL